MKCVSPLNLPLPNGKGSRDRIMAPCGRCMFCLSNKRNQWSFRLEQEFKICYSASFLTLTYDNENLPSDGNLKKIDFQLFMKRLRHSNLKQAWKHFPKIKTQAELSKLIPQLRYYSVGEYGTETTRPHYHSIMFNLQTGTLDKLQEIWNKGQIHRAPVNSATIAYVTKYVIQKEESNLHFGLTPEFSLMSRRPALGHNYLATKKYHQENVEYTVRASNGSRQELPRFYKDKFFTKNQQKARKLQSIIHTDKSDLENRNRLIKLGNNPEPYIIEQTTNHLNKLGKNATKNNKL